jgi:hypothetical protein
MDAIEDKQVGYGQEGIDEHGRRYINLDRRYQPAHLRRTHRKKPAPKTAITERVVAQRKEPLGACVRCGTTLPASASTGRPRLYCTPACRKAAYEDRRAAHPNAVRVQLVDRVITQTIERVEHRPHPSGACLTTVLADPALARQVLIGLSKQIGSKQITPADHAFRDLATSVDYLTQALTRAVNHQAGIHDAHNDEPSSS